MGVENHIRRKEETQNEKCTRIAIKAAAAPPGAPLAHETQVVAQQQQQQQRQQRQEQQQQQQQQQQPQDAIIEASDRIGQLDFRPLRLRAQQRLLWEQGFAQRVIEEYRRFLAFKAVFPQRMTPPLAIDKLWHLHVLDTARYQADCELILGKPNTLIHYTFDGEDSEGALLSMEEADTLQALRAAYTLRAYASRYNHKPPKDIWDFDDVEPETRAGGGEEAHEEDTKSVVYLNMPAGIRQDGYERYDVKLDLDTVDYFKEMFAERWGTPWQEQQITFKGTQLEAGRTLSSYGVKDESILAVRFFQRTMRIFVLSSGFSFKMDVSPKNTIKDMKIMIQEIKGIPVGRQRLIFPEVALLENDRTLEDYNIVDQSTIYVMRKIREVHQKR